MNVYKQIFEAFNKSGINYVIVGGIAVNLHGYSRFTGDLDILLLLNNSNLQKMHTLMQKLK